MKKYRPKKKDIILVEWKDAATHAEWIDGDNGATEEVKCTDCKTAGFFVGNKGGGFKVALSLSSDNDYGDILVIPSKQITAIYKLRTDG